MPEYALVKDGVILEYRNYAPNVDQTTLAPNKPRMLPVVRINEAYDPVTQTRTGPVITVDATQVTYTYTVAEKSVGEINEMRATKLRQLRNEFARRLDLILPSGAQFALLITGLVGILNTGLNRASWPQGVRDVFNPLFTTASTNGHALYATYKTKAAELAALTTAAEIAAYDVAAGW